MNGRPPGRLAVILAAVVVAGCGSGGRLATPDARVASIPAELIAVGRGSEKALRDKENADVWIYSPDGGFEMNLTQGHPATDDDPAFYDNGRRLVFASTRKSNDPAAGTGPSGIWTVGYDGSNPTKLPIRLTGATYRPAVSPDGTWVIFEVQHKDPATGKSVEDIGAYNTRTGKAAYLTNDALRDRDPAWCGTTRIVMTRGEGRGERQGLDIWVADFVPGDPPGLTNFQNLTFEPKDLPDHDPACDTTGTRMAFHTHRYQDNCAQYLNLPAGVGTRGEIAWLDLNDPARTIHRVTNGLCNDARPAWSPDGTRIAFSDRPLECSPDGTCHQGNWYLAIAGNLDIGSGPESVVRVQTASGFVTQSRRKDWAVRAP